MSSTTSKKRTRKRNATARATARRTMEKSSPESDAALGLSADRVPTLAARTKTPNSPRVKLETARPAPPPDATPLCLSHGKPGDALAIYHLMLAAGDAPSPAEFQAEEDHPRFDPLRRLVVKDRERLIAQVYLGRQVMLCGGGTIPTACFQRLTVLPEFRPTNLGAALLAAAERELAAGEELLAIAPAGRPDLFIPSGWAPLASTVSVTAPARHVLAALRDREPLAAWPRDSAPEYRIRGWRHVEQDGLMRIFATQAGLTWGPWLRDFDHWRWLVSRQAFDAIYVAIDGPDRMDLSTTDQVVGYAVVRQQRVLELVAAPGHAQAADQLLARVAGDAIEFGTHAIRLDAPADDPRLALFQSAGPRCTATQVEPMPVSFAKVLRPAALLEQLLPRLHERLKTAGGTLPDELGLTVGGEKFRLEFTKHGAKLSAGKLGRSHLALTLPIFTRLVLGQLDVVAAAAQGALDASTRHAVDLAYTLFPRFVFWRPTWEDLEA